MLLIELDVSAALQKLTPDPSLPPSPPFVNFPHNARNSLKEELERVAGRDSLLGVERFAQAVSC